MASTRPKTKTNKPHSPARHRTRRTGDSDEKRNKRSLERANMCRTIALAAISLAFLAACSGSGMSPTQSTATTGNLSCEMVDLHILYADPLPYQDRIICTEGYLQEQYPSVMIVPQHLTDEEVHFQHLEISGGGYDPSAFRSGDRIRAMGRFSFSEDCYNFYVVREGEVDDVAMLCGPPDVPMFLEVENMHRLEP